MHSTNSRSLRLRLPAVFLVAAVVAPSLALAEKACVSERIAFGCKSEEILEELGHLAQEDPAAFSKGVSSAVAMGACTIFPEPTTVFVEDRAIFSERRQVRREGDLHKWWMPAKWAPNGECPTNTQPQTIATQAKGTGAVSAYAPARAAPSTSMDRKQFSYEKRQAEDAPKPGCVYKDVMTEAEVMACK